MEYMDGGSLDKLVGGAGGAGRSGVPEDVLARIAGCMVRGLKFLKDELQIIHRGTPICPPAVILTFSQTSNRPTSS